MTHKFKVGDVVELNSGSPKMTVSRTHDPGAGSSSIADDEVGCVWFVGNIDGAELRHARFTINSLKLAEATASYRS